MNNRPFSRLRALFFCLVLGSLLTFSGCSSLNDSELASEVKNQVKDYAKSQAESYADQLIGSLKEYASSQKGGSNASATAEVPVFSDEDTAASYGLNVHFIDVGQGDSILVESAGHFMLIDAGENNQGETVVSYLKQAGVSSLDYVIGTHPHSDHIGGLDNVIRSFDTKTLFLPPVEHTTATFEDVLDAAEEKGLSITAPVPGDSFSLGEASFTLLSPVKEYDDDLNDWSVGVRLSYGDNAFVMCGDAEEKAEQDIIKSGATLSADVLKAGHHGSNTATSDSFLKAVSPSVAVISCGKGNSYGHPHKETMEKLEKAGVNVLRTDELGTIIAHSDGTAITWSNIPAAD